jgi:hypothetical protein
MLDARIPDEVALMVLAHIEDPCDVLRVRQTCCRALRLSQGLSFTFISGLFLFLCC